MALIRFFFSLRAVGERGRIYPYHSNNMNKAQYHEYLLSEEWKLRRKEVFKYHGRNCKKCDGNIGIHIHHRTYVRVGKEDIQNDLIPLCPNCHKAVHAIVKKKKISIWSATQLYLEEKITDAPLRVKFRWGNKKRKKKQRASYYRKASKPSSDHRVKKLSLIDIEKLKEMYHLEEVPDFILVR